MFDRSTRSARTIPLLVSLAAAFAAIAGCSFDPTAPGAGIERGFVSHPLETELLRQVNDYRSSYGLHALTMNDVLSRQARLHSEDMAKGRMRFGHDGFKQRATTIRDYLSVIDIAENVAVNQGFDDPVTAAVGSLIESPGHRHNIVGEFDLTGVGVAKSSDGRIFYTQLFANSGRRLR